MKTQKIVIIALSLATAACTIAPTEEDFLNYPKQGPVYLLENHTLFRSDIECVAQLIEQSPFITRPIRIGISVIPNIVGETASKGLVPKDSSLMVMSALSNLSDKVKIVNNAFSYLIGGQVTEVNELGSVEGGASSFGLGAKFGYELLRVATDITLKDLKSGEVNSYPQHSLLRYKQKAGGSMFFLVNSSITDANFNQKIISPVSFAVRENIEKTMALILNDILFQESKGRQSALGCLRTPYQIKRQAAINKTIKIENIILDESHTKINMEINNAGRSRTVFIDFIYFNEPNQVIDQFNVSHYIAAHDRTQLQISVEHPAKYLEVKIHAKKNILATKTIPLVFSTDH